MKTPMQRLKEILLRQRDYNLSNFQKYPSNSETYESKLFLCDDILDSIDSYLMQEEKEVITDAYVAGEREWLMEYEGGRDAYTKRASYKYYDETFDTKE